MSEQPDDLETTLMLAAAAADSRQFADQSENNDSASAHFTDQNDQSRSDNEWNKDSDEEKVCIQNSVKEIKIVETTNRREKRKRSRDEKEIDIPNKLQKSIQGFSHIVATHYNQLEEKGLDERSKSRIIYLRNFHNWIKSMLINEYLTYIKSGKKQHNAPLRVHDMGCGKGGDLHKWKKGSITHLTCSDIAGISLEQCKARYQDMVNRSLKERGGGNMFSIEYIEGNFTKVRLREKYSDPSMKFDLVSCQFAFHYSFETLPQAECLFRNAGECLQPGGFFIGTMPDSNELIARAAKSKSNSFGNSVYNVKLDFDFNHPPLFGGKYDFYLDGVVNCPEFLVHFPTFVKLAKKYGLKLVKKEKFYNFFRRMESEGRQLLTTMRGLETYPPPNGCDLVGTAADDYTHAKEFMKNTDNDKVKLGTLSKSEWEVSSLYITFAFEKAKNTWNSDGTPCYKI
ncbi:mRNA cap guanine-N7 methyltransferase [Cylas formicarius]|uniref:mRNA cap guanine-N7 methyltransferase n=1 Tax=Cylas formicarius TaxID=197179 RepID=UPI0029587572|nr:mRNA cap guanine-N7 methyltransferase [Cylas formicarius]